jgi:hypothetical protein
MLFPLLNTASARGTPISQTVSLLNPGSSTIAVGNTPDLRVYTAEQGENSS